MRKQACCCSTTSGGTLNRSRRTPPWRRPGQQQHHLHHRAGANGADVTGPARPPPTYVLWQGQEHHHVVCQRRSRAVCTTEAYWTFFGHTIQLLDIDVRPIKMGIHRWGELGMLYYTTAYPSSFLERDAGVLVCAACRSAAPSFVQASFLFYFPILTTACTPPIFPLPRHRRGTVGSRSGHTIVVDIISK